MTETSNDILKKLIRNSAHGATVTQDDLINLGLILSRERAGGVVLEPAEETQKPPVFLAAPGLHCQVVYSVARTTLPEEHMVVANSLHSFMLQNRIVQIEACMDPWSNIPVTKAPKG